MISDIKALAGIESYLKKDGSINLGASVPTIIRSSPPLKDRQFNISGIQLLLEHEDLNKLMNFQFDDNNKPLPLFRISVMKEMFPGLFADPFSHRVHNIAGFLDFNEGKLTNGKVMEIDGVPTIVSTGQEECVWVSKKYELPNTIEIDAIAWELATSKLTPPDSFHYHIKITTWDFFGYSSELEIGTSSSILRANAKRTRDDLDTFIPRSHVKSFQITFTAKVFEDSYMQERHLPTTFNEKMGRPLLRAINILEPVQSSYEIYSLTELKNISSDFHLFEMPGPQIKRLMATIDLSAVIVHSVNQDHAKYEFLELSVLYDGFTNFEARVNAFELMRERT